MRLVRRLGVAMLFASSQGWGQGVVAEVPMLDPWVPPAVAKAAESLPKAKRGAELKAEVERKLRADFPEYAAFQRDASGFVTDLYAAFFDRAPDSGGLGYWTGLIAQGMPRDVVYVSFLFSPEFDGFMRNAVGPTAARSEVDTVLDFYRGLLGRLPDSGGLDVWLRQFRRAQCDGPAAVYASIESISSAFADSPEYAARARSHEGYVGDLYNAFMRRGGDLQGVQFWISQLQNGTATRAQVRRSFMASPEFSARVQRMVTETCLL